MKPIYSVLVCVVLTTLALFTGYSNYRFTENALYDDLNQALQKVMSQKNCYLVRQDTIRAYRMLAQNAGEGSFLIRIADEMLRRNLTIRELRNKSYIVCLLQHKEPVSAPHALHSDTFVVNTPTNEGVVRLNSHGTISYQSYAECSPLFILS